MNRYSYIARYILKGDLAEHHINAQKQQLFDCGQQEILDLTDAK